MSTGHASDSTVKYKNISGHFSKDFGIKFTCIVLVVRFHGSETSLNYHLQHVHCAPSTIQSQK